MSNNEFDAPIETIVAIANDILDTEDPKIQGKMLTLLDEKITNLNSQISESENRGNFHTGHVDILQTILHEIRMDMQKRHNADGTCQQCALIQEFFTIAGDDANRTD